MADVPPARSLAALRPDLAAEWHPSRNGRVSPHDVTCGLTRKVWWLCGAGHAYDAAVGHRAGNGSGCPFCSNRRVLAGFNDLSTTHPELAAEWHPVLNGGLAADGVIAGANKKRWWLCAAGHEWEALSSHRAGPRRIGCPYCSNSRVMPGATDLASTHLRLAKEWHPERNGDLRPEHVMAGSDRVVWWLCARGHSYEAACSARSGPKPSGCPVCSGRVVHPGTNDLATTDPLVARQWHPTLNGDIDVRSVSRGVALKAWWRCDSGHEWQQAVASRVRGGRGCPGCEAGRALLRGVNDLATTHPALAGEWDPDGNGDLSPADVTAGSARRIRWRCSRGHGWDAVCYSRTVSGHASGCPYCGNRKVLAGFNDLATTHPWLAAQWHPEFNGPLAPQEVTAGTSRPVWWRCGMGHEWRSALSSRKDGERACPVCSGNQVLAGYNDLATTHPAVAAQWHSKLNAGTAPDSVTAGSGALMWWRCDLAHEWRAAVHSRTGPQATGCPYCGNKKVLVGFNDLATTNPELAAQWHPTRNGDLTPADVTAGTRHKVWWLCPVGHEWAAIGSNRVRLQVGCPDCAPVGFSPNSPGATYVITDGTAHKVGVMGWDEKRLARHRQLGWRLVRTWRFEIGHDAYELEQTVVRRLRQELHLAPGYPVAQMPQGGATETVAASDIPVADLCALVDCTCIQLGLAPVVTDEQPAPF